MIPTDMAAGSLPHGTLSVKSSGELACVCAYWHRGGRPNPFIHKNLRSQENHRFCLQASLAMVQYAHEKATQQHQVHRRHPHSGRDYLWHI